jgi:hypothetical protein
MTPNPSEPTELAMDLPVDHLELARRFAAQAALVSVPAAIAPIYAEMHAKLVIAQELRRIGDLLEHLVNLSTTDVDALLGDLTIPAE